MPSKFSNPFDDASTAHQHFRTNSIDRNAFSVSRSSDGDSIRARPFSTASNPYLVCVDDAGLRLSLMPDDPHQVSFAVETGITFDEPPIDLYTVGANAGGSRCSNREASEGRMVIPASVAGPPSGGYRAPCVCDAPDIQEVYFPQVGTAINRRDIGHACHKMPQAIEANRRPIPLDMDCIAQGSYPSGLPSPTLAELCGATSDGPLKIPTFDTILPADTLASVLADAEHNKDIDIRKDVGNQSVAGAIKPENSSHNIRATAVTQASQSTGAEADVYRTMLTSAVSSYSSFSGRALPMVNAAHAAGIPHGPRVKQPLRPRPLPGLPQNPRDTQDGLFLPGKATDPKEAPEPYYPERFQLYDAGIENSRADIMFDNKWQLSGGMDAVVGGRRRGLSNMEEDQVQNEKLVREANLKASENRQAQLMAGLKAAQVEAVKGATFSRILGDAAFGSLGRKKKRMEILKLFTG